MNLIERLDRICEYVFPFPPKCCSGKKTQIEGMRFSRRLRFQMMLKELNEEEQEIKIREWESKYNVNGAFTGGR